MSTELSFLDKLVEDLIKSKHNNYSQECINFYIDDSLFSIQDIQRVHNERGERLKCSLIRHKKQQDSRRTDHTINSKCIIYLHGFGSSRLEALSLVEHLPLEYCICIFDMSGSGKSEGQKITYGLKEQQDIDPIISFLHQRKLIREFIIWGRSMGAVAALLYAINHQQLSYSKSREKKMLYATQSLKNSVILPSKGQGKAEQQPIIHSLVLDSPFFKFSEIAKEIAQKKLIIPSFLLDIALGYVEESFNKILSQSIGQHYNPFNINFDQKIKLNIPLLFVYSENDQIIAPSHCERLMKCMESKYKKILINSCTHNQTRPEEAVQQIFGILDKFIKVAKSNGRKMEIESFSKASKEFSSNSMNKSLDKKRGIIVYTPSKDLKKQELLTSQPKFHETVNIQVIRTEQLGLKSPRYRSHSKKSIVTLSTSKKSRKPKELDTISTQNQPIPHLNSIDLQMNKFLNKKLIDPQQQNRGLKMTRTNKRYGYDKCKEFKFSNEKQLN